MREFGDADFPLFSVFSVIFGPLRSLFSPISSFSFWTFCLFSCSFSVRRHAHVDFQLFSQKSCCHTEIEVADQTYCSIWSQLRTCLDSSLCYHTETEVADQTYCSIWSQYTDTGPSRPSLDSVRPGARWGTNLQVTGRSGCGKVGSHPVSATHGTDALPFDLRVLIGKCIRAPTVLFGESAGCRGIEIHALAAGCRGIEIHALAWNWLSPSPTLAKLCELIDRWPHLSYCYYYWCCCCCCCCCCWY